MALILNGTDGVSDVDGTAATPAVRGTDTNTGIFFPAADTIAFAEGGAEVARFDSAGNLGIGTISPGAKLDVQAGATSDAVSIRSTLNTNGSAVAGAALFGGNSSGTSVAYSGIYGNIDSNTAGSHGGGMRFFTATSGSFTEKMRLNSSGNLGIGTTSFTGISGRTTQVIRGTTSELLLQSSSATNGTVEGITLSAAGSDAYYVNRLAGAHIWTSGSAGNFERARITSDGNLLVGTTVNRTGANLTSAGGVGTTNAVTNRFTTVEYGSGANGSFTTITVSVTVPNSSSSVIVEVLLTGFNMYLDHVAARYSNQAPMVMRNNASAGTTVSSLAVDGAVTTYTLTITTGVTHPVIKVKATAGGLAESITLPTITFA